jgi:hypothetical protein
LDLVLQRDGPGPEMPHLALHLAPVSGLRLSQLSELRLHGAKLLEQLADCHIGEVSARRALALR